MNDNQKQHVEDSFQLVLPIGRQAAALFYDRLVNLDPSLRPLFKGDIEEQGIKLMSTLRLAVNGLDEPEKIVLALQHLGRSHVKYGVQDSHYAVVGQALIWTLAQGLGDQFTDEVRSAWVATYDLLSTVMRDAAQQVMEGELTR